MSNVRETSVEAYKQILATIGRRQFIVYSAIKNSAQPLTDREIAKTLGYRDPNAVRPRRFELAEKGLIVEAGRRICSVSGKLAITWQAK